ncbi:type 1 glutamine amidotransferase [Auraticoccus sp. F435]|uniref:Type 1 glutamine amidotransferase n=1 Tax=Auraticoccus cholistanensis TaxID=2656650 RepID=A0A6A9UV81_9ACTN|nr:type 1 glutamine amidotransferase [Auraticoccus cholistanensis]
MVVQNAAGSGPGRLLDWLDEDGLTCEVVQACDGQPVPESAAGVDAVVLLGGGLLPDEDTAAPWLAAERALTADALRTGVPLLGICLGGQLLAHVAGGVVTGRSGETERGSCPVRLLEPAGDDPVFAPLAGEDRLWMIQNHRDSITTPPPAGVLLATSDACRVQAFRVGPRAWGLQFHPEVDAQRLRRWDESALAAQGLDRAEMIAAAEAVAETNTRQARQLAGAFARVVDDHHRARRTGGPDTRQEATRWD